MKDSPESIPTEIESALATIAEWVWERFGAGNVKLTKRMPNGLVGIWVEGRPLVLIDTRSTIPSETKRLLRSSNWSTEGSWSLPKAEDLEYVTQEGLDQIVEDMTQDEKAEIRRLHAIVGVYQEFVAAYRGLDELLESGIDSFSRAHIVAASQRVEQADKAVTAIEREDKLLGPGFMARGTQVQQSADLIRAGELLRGFLHWLRAHGRDEIPRSVTEATVLIGRVQKQLEGQIVGP